MVLTSHRRLVLVRENNYFDIYLSMQRKYQIIMAANLLSFALSLLVLASSNLKQDNKNLKRARVIVQRKMSRPVPSEAQSEDKFS